MVGLKKDLSTEQLASITTPQGGRGISYHSFPIMSRGFGVSMFFGIRFSILLISTNSRNSRHIKAAFSGQGFLGMNHDYDKHDFNEP